MTDNYLITGYWGEPHVTAENDRGINAATFGVGRFVLPVGQQFKAEYIGNNTIRLYDGKLMDNGAAAGIPTGEYVDLLIPNAGQGMNRNDLIVFQYSQDASTLIERGEFVVIQGVETEGTATDPELTQGDLLSNETTFEQMPLWRVSVSGAAIAAPVRVFEVVNGYGNIESAEHPGCFYRMVDGEKEWFNPPFELGTVYRLAERHNGEIVYARMINLGNLPNTTNKTISTGINGSKAVSIEPIIYMASGGITPYPFVDAKGASMVRIYLGTNGTLYVSSFSDGSGSMGKVIIKYTK